MSAPNPNLLTPYSPIYRDTTTDFLNLTEEEKTARVQTFSRAFDKYSNAIFDAEETKAVILNPSYFNFLKTKEEMLTDLQQNLDHLYLKLSASRIRISEDMEPLPKAYNVKDPINHWESYLETLHIARFKNRADDYESEVMNLQKQAEKYPDFLALKCDSLDEQYKALQNKAREFPKLQRFLPKDYTEVIDVFRKSVKSYNPRNKCICHY